jgi:hypothetical protein
MAEIWHQGKWNSKLQNDTNPVAIDRDSAELWRLKVRKKVVFFEKSCTFGGFRNTAEAMHRFEPDLLQTWRSLFVQEIQYGHILPTWRLSELRQLKVGLWVQLALLVVFEISRERLIRMARDLAPRWTMFMPTSFQRISWCSSMLSTRCALNWILYFPQYLRKHPTDFCQEYLIRCGVELHTDAMKVLLHQIGRCWDIAWKQRKVGTHRVKITGSNLTPLFFGEPFFRLFDRSYLENYSSVCVPILTTVLLLIRTIRWNVYAVCEIFSWTVLCKTVGFHIFSGLFRDAGRLVQ